MDDLISRQTPIETRRYTFGNDEFSLEDAYHDCKLVFDGITDDDSFQEADTGLILYYANEIIYALQEALEGKDTNVPTNDCISRQKAIDAFACTDELNVSGRVYAQNVTNYINKVIGKIKALPSVQSKNEERMEKSAQYVPNDDLISRKAAIEALLELVEARRTWVSIEDARKEISGIDASMCAIHDLPSVQPMQLNTPNTLKALDCISRQAVLNYIVNMPSELTADGRRMIRRVILMEYIQNSLPSVQPTISGYDIRHLELIASVLQKENLPPERVTEALTDIGRIVAIIKKEFEEALRKAVEQCMT